MYFVFSFGAGQISVSKFVGKICDLLSDANSQVRVAALNCLVEIYQHVGVRVRMDLSKKGLPPTKLQMVLQKFDEVDSEGNGVTGGNGVAGGNGVNGDDVRATIITRGLSFDSVTRLLSN